LLDVGHCLRAGEDAAAEAIRAGSRLGAVHVTDVDGDAERIPFFSGRLTPAKVEQLLRALRGAKYSGPITLGLEATLDTPVQHLDDARAAVQRLLSALDG
jgi:sugar phosphate isomerase/epimerase